MSEAPPGRVGRLPLRVNISWTVAGNAVYAASLWGMVVVLAKLLDAEAVGRFALALAITAPLFLLAGLNLRAVQATDAREEYAFGDYLALRLVTTGTALAAALGIGAGFGSGAGAVIAVLAAAKAMEALSDIIYGLLQHRERLDHMARSLMLRGPLALGLMAATVAATDSLVWGTVAIAGAWAAVLVAHDLPTGRRVLGDRRGTGGRLAPRWSGAAMRRLAWLAAPLGAVAGLISLTANVPRYAVERYLGEADLGVFAAIAYLVIAGSTVVNAMGQSAAPRLSQYHAAGGRIAFRSLLGRLVAIAALLGLAGLSLSTLIGRRVLTVLYDEQYAQLDVLLWLMAAGTLTYVATLLGYGMTAARYFRAQLPLFTATTVTVTVLSLALVPEFGLEGAAGALAIAASVQIGGSLLILRRDLSRRGAPEVTPAQSPR